MLSWVYYDFENRRDDFVEFFLLVKLHLLPTAYLEEKVSSQKLVKESHQCMDYFQKELLYRLKMPSYVQEQTDRKLSGKQSRVSESSNGSEPNVLASGDRKSLVSREIKYEAAALSELTIDDSVDAHVLLQDNQPSTSKLAVAGKKPSVVPRRRKLQSPGGISGNEESTSGSKPPHTQDVNISKELVRILRHGKYSSITIDRGI